MSHPEICLLFTPFFCKPILRRENIKFEQPIKYCLSVVYNYNVKKDYSNIN